MDADDIIGAVSSVIQRMNAAESEIARVHAMLDHLGVVGGGMSDAPLHERVAALGRFVVAKHGQYSAGSPGRWLP